jgi:UDPglucose 6-dehydrogenase
MKKLYAPLERSGVTILMTTVETSELMKYAANSFLSMKISFINEMADLCEIVGADVSDIADGIGLDARIGPQFLNAGPGYGGSCFPKDCRALISTARKVGKPLKVVEAVVEGKRGP